MRKLLLSLSIIILATQAEVDKLELGTPYYLQSDLDAPQPPILETNKRGNKNAQ